MIILCILKNVRSKERKSVEWILEDIWYGNRGVQGINTDGDESTTDESMADGSTADADESTMTSFAPQNIKTMILITAVDTLAVTERVDAVVR